MKKYITSLAILAVIALISLSFRSSSTKYGPRLSAVLDNSSQSSFIVYVFFTDKGPEADSRLSDPLSLVTQASIDRRMNVKTPDKIVEMVDVPLYQPYVQTVA